MQNETTPNNAPSNPGHTDRPYTATSLLCEFCCQFDFFATFHALLRPISRIPRRVPRLFRLRRRRGSANAPEVGLVEHIEMQPLENLSQELEAHTEIRASVGSSLTTEPDLNNVRECKFVDFVYCCACNLVLIYGLIQKTVHAQFEPSQFHVNGSREKGQSVFEWVCPGVLSSGKLLGKVCHYLVLTRDISHILFKQVKVSYLYLFPDINVDEIREVHSPFTSF